MHAIGGLKSCHTMADEMFSFEAMNEDEGGGASEDEYDALNDETFGDGLELDWEEEHEQLAHITESSRRSKDHLDLEASLSRLVLDEADAPQRPPAAGHPPGIAPAWPAAPNSVSGLKNVCTVEELERQLRQGQPQQQMPQQNFYQPRFPTMILQRPPGLQGPVPLPFAPQQALNPALQMNQLNHNQPMGQMVPQPGQMVPHNQMGANHQMGHNQMGHANQMGPNAQMMNGNQFGMNQMGTNQLPMIPPHMMGQPRMMGPPPCLNNVPRQNFNPNMGQFNPNFRAPMDSSVNKQQNMMMNQSQPQALNQPMHSQSQSQPMYNQSAPQMTNQMNQSQPSAQMFSQSSPNQMSQGQIGSQQPQMSQKKRQGEPKQKAAAQTRIFNNSNLAYQNLVQLMNAHPMLQMHNSLHNASHHPLNIWGNAFNNKVQNSNQQMFNNQRNNNGGYNNNNRYMNGEEFQPNGHPQRDSSDEYAGLMSQREKHWLLNIQMLQLNTGTPYIDDYYYTVFLERQSRKEKEGMKEAHKANQQNHPFYSGGKQESRERHRHNSTSEEQPTPRTYVPTQFENSLGKLQCGSVTAPRKIIDVEVVRESEPGGAPSARQSRAPSVASTTHHEGPREIRRTKQSLLDIEALYLVLLRLEELNDPLAIANAFVLREREEKSRLAEAQRLEEEGAPPDANLFLRHIESVQRRAPARASDAPDKTLDKRQVVALTSAPEPPRTKNLLDESKEELVGRIFAGLLHEERLQLYLGIRKGKTLVERFLARAPAPHPRLRALWARLLRALPAAARRDVRDDHALPRLAPAFRRYIASSTGWAAIVESCAHLAEALDPARPPHALLTPFTLTCVTILMEKASTLINTPDATSNERQWTKFLKSLARTLKSCQVAPAKPTEPMKPSDVQYHVKLLESKSTVEILQRGKTTTEFADLSKNELGEILVKHLC